MIEYVKGQIAELTPAIAVIDCHGVGYGLNISLNTFSALQGKQEAKLYVYEAIREDAYVLYGFSTRQERALFLLLISVSGIGGNTARMILSAPHTGRIGQRHQFRQRQAAQDRERHRAENRPTHHRGPERQNRIDGNRRDGSPGTSATAATGHSKYWKRPWPPLPCWASRPPPRKKVALAILKEEPEAAVERVIKLALKRL